MHSLQTAYWELRTPNSENMTAYSSHFSLDWNPMHLSRGFKHMEIKWNFLAFGEFSLDISSVILNTKQMIYISFYFELYSVKDYAYGRPLILLMCADISIDTKAGQGKICRQGEGLCHRRCQALSGIWINQTRCPRGLTKQEGSIVSWIRPSGLWCFFSSIKKVCILLYKIYKNFTYQFLFKALRRSKKSTLP